MAGNIYARQKCWICKGPLRHDDRRRGCFCDKHPDVQATKGFIVRFGKKISLSFPTYDQAYQHLMGLRYEKAGGKLDVRDHMASNPLGFANVANEYLK